jgi:sialate O-acetylesterase
MLLRLTVMSTLFFPLLALGEVTLPHVISDHAVLQREQPLRIWGWASPGEKIVVGFHHQTVMGQADGLGRWHVWLQPEEAGGPFTLTVTGDATAVALKRQDLLVGDVWVASGQSNMEIPLQGFPGKASIKNADSEIAHADLPTVRLLRVPTISSVVPQPDQPSTWTVCDPKTAAKFSAVAYFFGREIAQREHVPIGLIDSTWGGTPAEAWTSMDALTADSALMPVFATRARLMDEQTKVQLLLDREAREDAAAKAKGLVLAPHPWHPTPESAAPAGLFNGMIAPLTGLSIKGAIWYQGEQNAVPDRVPIYAHLFQTLISDWRAQWGEGDFPFLFVQLANFNASSNGVWGQLRDSQRRALQLTNTAMTVALDVGDPQNIHPADKQSVGHRLALDALAIAYKEPGEYSGPLFRRATAEGATLRVWFDHAQDGLVADSACVEGCFEIAGPDGQFYAATAHVEGSTVVLHSDKVTTPETVRYGWADVPRGVLYNKAGLPAGTFTSAER